MDSEISRFRVLVVDDNIEAAEILQMLLEMSGYEVRRVSSGEDGLIEADIFKPHAVISDIRMPGMDGLEMAAALRRRYGSSKLLLIAVSGYSAQEVKTSFNDAGFDSYFPKPVCYDEISSRLSSYISHL